MHCAQRFRGMWSVAGLIAFACALDVESRGEGKACSSDGRCAEGYLCNPEHRCVTNLPGTDATTDAEGAGGDAGSNGASGTGGAIDASGATGGTGAASSGGSSAGQGGTPNDGGGRGGWLPEAGGRGGSVGDAAPDVGCVDPIRYYSDADRDGFGRDDVTQWSCSAPAAAWATLGGDCNDANERVFPGQSAYFGAPYSVSGGVSFDFDCNGSEDPDSTQEGPSPNCAGLSLLGCSGSGFATTGRAGAGVDPSCGSASLVTCTPNLVTCGSSTTTTQAKRCR
jgi:hypothetical protein